MRSCEKYEKCILHFHPSAYNKHNIIYTQRKQVARLLYKFIVCLCIRCEFVYFFNLSFNLWAIISQETEKIENLEKSLERLDTNKRTVLGERGEKLHQIRQQTGNRKEQLKLDLNVCTTRCAIARSHKGTHIYVLVRLGIGKLARSAGGMFGCLSWGIVGGNFESFWRCRSCLNKERIKE